MAKKTQEKWDSKEMMSKWGMHKIMMGLGLIVFGLVLSMSSRAALDANLSWHWAFIVIGILVILKGVWMSNKMD